MDENGILLFGFIFIFLMTTLGAACVYCVKTKKIQKWQPLFFGFAAGVMLAASIWSLLLPALELSQIQFKEYALIPIVVSFLIGGICIPILDNVFLKKNPSGLKKSSKLFLAVTLHNIPEGLAVGFAYGVAYLSGEYAAYMAALGLAIGIGFQNFPEGMAISLPVRAEGTSKHKAFLYGFASGAVEPLFSFIGFFAATMLQSLQLWALAFSAGAMYYVVAGELLPDIGEGKGRRFGVIGALIGFLLMMGLDVALG